MKNKKEKYFIVYEVVKNEEGKIIDISNCYDNDSLKSVAKWLGIDYTNVSKYIIDNLDSLDNLDSIRIKQLNEKHIVKNNYFIFKDYE